MLDPGTGSVRRVIALQYNPRALNRSVQPQWYEPQKEDSPEGGDRQLRFKGPAVETIKIEAEIDATDKKEAADSSSKVHEVGIHPELAALETLVYPTAQDLNDREAKAKNAFVEIAGLNALLTVFVWSSSRVVPVQLTDYQINEQFFDGNLNPIQAKVSISMRVLTVDDLGFDHQAGKLFMAYLKKRENLAEMSFRGNNSQGGFDSLGISNSRLRV